MTCDEFIKLYLTMEKRRQERIAKQKELPTKTVNFDPMDSLMDSFAQLVTHLEDELVLKKAFATFSKKDRRLIRRRLKALEKNGGSM